MTMRSLGEALIEVGPGKITSHEDGIFGTSNIGMIEYIVTKEPGGQDSAVQKGSAD